MTAAELAISTPALFSEDTVAAVALNAAAVNAPVETEPLCSKPVMVCVLLVSAPDELILAAVSDPDTAMPKFTVASPGTRNDAADRGVRPPAAVTVPGVDKWPEPAFMHRLSAPQCANALSVDTVVAPL